MSLETKFNNCQGTRLGSKIQTPDAREILAIQSATKFADLRTAAKENEKKAARPWISLITAAISQGESPSTELHQDITEELSLSIHAPIYIPRSHTKEARLTHQ